MSPSSTQAKQTSPRPAVVTPAARELRGSSAFFHESQFQGTLPKTGALRLVECRPMLEHGIAQPPRRPRVDGFSPSSLGAEKADVESAPIQPPTAVETPRASGCDRAINAGDRLEADSFLLQGLFSERAALGASELVPARAASGTSSAESAECGLTREQRVGELYKSFYHRVFCFARRSVSDDEAEEVAHETFVRLLRVRNLERMSISVAYLLRIADNLLKRKHERAQRYRVVLERSSMVVLGGEEACEPGSDRGQGACGAVVEQFDSDRIHSAMRRLTSEEQTAIRLIVCEGLDYQAAARSMGVRVSTINNWKHRGLAKLKQFVGIDRSASSDAAAVAVG